MLSEEALVEEALGYDKRCQMKFGCIHRILYGSSPAKALPRLERDLANSYYWSGNVCKDYAFFIANWHPLLGICLCHPAHPWTKKQRFIMLMVTISGTTVPTARLLQGLDPEDETLKVTTYLNIFIHITLPVMLWESTLYRLTVLDLYCKGRRNVFCRLCVCIVRCLRRCCFWTALFFSGVMLVASSLILGSSSDQGAMVDVIRPVGVSCAQSWIFWFPIWMALPYIGFAHYWCIERRQHAHGALSLRGFSLHGDMYVHNTQEPADLELEDSSWKLLEES